MPPPAPSLTPLRHGGYGQPVSTFITTLDGTGTSTGTGPRLAVKDIIDVAGIPTTGGSRALERLASPAQRDAPCLAGARAAGARIVGKTNLHELAVLPLGTNPWFGTPQNPLDPALIPGGSSSGSAVAVATGDADVAYGTDTGGSVRIPSACCGTAGLKTTHGRISLDGVWPLAPSFDTVGPMARDIAGLELGMQLLEPGFAGTTTAARRIGRVKTAADPAIDAAVDAALAAAGFDVVPIELDMELGSAAFTAIYFAEFWAADHELAEGHPDGVGDDVKQMLALADMFRPGLEGGTRQREQWITALTGAFVDVELLALPTMPLFPPRIDEIPAEPTELVIALSSYASPFNAAGAPATAQPVPAQGSAIPASLQLVGPAGAEDLLLATAKVVESAVS
jgi:amidase